MCKEIIGLMEIVQNEKNTRWVVALHRKYSRN